MASFIDSYASHCELAAELAAHGAILKSVAYRLELTPGTLRRRLTQHGTTHSEMVDLVTFSTVAGPAQITLR